MAIDLGVIDSIIAAVSYAAKQLLIGCLALIETICLGQFADAKRPNQ